MARLSGSMWKSGDYKIHNGTVDDIPFGWVLATELCDRAIVGAGNSYNHKQTFGNDSVRPAKPSVSVLVNNHTLSTARIPAHNHASPIRKFGSGTRTTQTDVNGSGSIVYTSNSGGSQAHNHGASVTVSDVGTVDTRQKSIALIWIRKL